MSIRTFYDRWPQYNKRLTETIAALTPEQLALRPSPDHWPIWAIVGHLAGTRVYWLCAILGEPGADTTPFGRPDAEGWEDDLDHPRPASDLVTALDETYAIVDGVLERWTPDMLTEAFERLYGDRRQFHTRTSVLQRLLTHEAYHDGEIAQTLGVNGLEPPDIWRPD
jgi:uncharacterized damage-inducible protein DinB